MKSILFFFASVFIATALILMACESKVRMSSDMVPVPVKTNFKKKFPTIAEPVWYLKESKYEAEFTMGAVKKHVWFEGEGQFIKETLD
jgi:hypothetical protein